MKEKRMRKHYRQGDVLVIESTIPKGANVLPRENGKIVLAHGEVTGHSHAIASPDASFLGQIAEGARRRFLDAKNSLLILHEEHAPIQIVRGEYEVVIQREYTPGAIRNVAD